MNVIDLFSGVGGLSSGFKKAGYDIILANEIDPMIAESYRKNHPETLMINRDIKYLADNFKECIEENLALIDDPERRDEIRSKLSSIDVIIGGPPCQGFSMAGARIRKTNEFIEDPRNFLFKYYFKLLQIFEPEFFVFENVPGLVNLKNGDILNEITKIFSDASEFSGHGYNIETKIIDSTIAGVPQKRKRLIILGSKTHKIDILADLKEFTEARKIPDDVTVSDAISDLNYLESGDGEFISEYKSPTLKKYQIARRTKTENLYNHVAPLHAEKTIARIAEIKQGENYRNLKDHESIKSVHSGSYGRLEWNKSSPTITTRFDTPSAGRVIHPELNRSLTPREAARIQSFDDDFVFYGNKSSIGKQIGNAVPPLLAEAIANVILKYQR
ncbi:DNA cytosine methyltransferase [Jeotgalicoccus psychrophilus]|uniref:DNA cytosine methyltransferase n=1 Tax=Jeotgalicoccus psychrophilus TaxID=157228 RepID=UPI0003F4F804|nr:DNA cytosine methyltransferase [Jeotgalicoccus psychrophilus]